MNRLLLLIAAFLFSTGGAAIKATSLGAWQVASFRSGIAAIALAALVPKARRALSWRTWLVSLTYAATLVLFVVANKLTTSANAIYLQSTAPLYLLLLGPFVLHESIRLTDILVICGVASGFVLLLLGSETIVATAPDPPKGNILGAISGLTWALTMTGLRWLGKYEKDPNTTTATVIAGNFVACVACLPMALPIGRISFIDASVLLYLGIFQIGLAYLALTHSIRFVPALEATTLLLVEPVFNPIWTWIVHGENPSGFAMAGGAVILATTFCAAVIQNRKSAA